MSNFEHAKGGEIVLPFRGDFKPAAELEGEAGNTERQAMKERSRGWAGKPEPDAMSKIGHSLMFD